MGRTTRAALRSRELADEATSDAASVPLPATPQRVRIPLGEISENQVSVQSPNPEPTMVTIPFNPEPAKPAAKKGKGKKGKGKAKGTKKDKENVKEGGVEILEDGNQSSASSAVEETRQNLEDGNTGGGHPVVDLDTADTISQSPAAELASQELLATGAREVDAAEMEELGKEVEAMDIKGGQGPQAMTPDVSTQNTADSEAPAESDKIKDDSFVNHIRSRSPAKRVSRIEDSVEALDKLDEELEKVAEAIPLSKKAPNENLKDKNLVKTTPKGPSANKQNPQKVRNPQSALRTKPNEHLKRTEKPTRSSPSADPPKVTATRKPIDRKPQLKQGQGPKSPVVPAKDIAQRASSAKPAAATNKRVSSIHKAPFQPTKSTKPPTLPSFELPGEAISRKLKEQREERLQKEAEEKAKNATFKARPVRVSKVPEVRMTTATKARLSMAMPNRTDPSKTPNGTIRSKGPPPVLQTNTNSTSKRLSSLYVPKQSKIVPTVNPASKRVSSVNPNLRRPSVSPAAATASTARASPTAQDLAQQKQKGKAAFSRPRNEIAEREKGRREKEEAAKKARMEAAERGRLASRQWAEKQKSKTAVKASAEKPEVAAA